MTEKRTPSSTCSVSPENPDNCVRKMRSHRAINLIRTGHLLIVEEVIFGKRAFTSPISALTPVADLILEKWNSMERTHQDALRLQLQGLLWRIRDRQVSELRSHRTAGIDLDVEMALRGIKLASCVWGELNSDQRRRIRTRCGAFAPRQWRRMSFVADMVVEPERQGTRRSSVMVT